MALANKPAVTQLNELVQKLWKPSGSQGSLVQWSYHETQPGKFVATVRIPTINYESTGVPQIGRKVSQKEPANAALKYLITHYGADGNAGKLISTTLERNLHTSQQPNECQNFFVASSSVYSDYYTEKQRRHSTPDTVVSSSPSQKSTLKSGASPTAARPTSSTHFAVPLQFRSPAAEALPLPQFSSSNRLMSIPASEEVYSPELNSPESFSPKLNVSPTKHPETLSEEELSGLRNQVCEMLDLSNTAAINYRTILLQLVQKRGRLFSSQPQSLLWEVTRTTNNRFLAHVTVQLTEDNSITVKQCPSLKFQKQFEGEPETSKDAARESASMTALSHFLNQAKQSSGVAKLFFLSSQSDISDQHGPSNCPTEKEQLSIENEATFEKNKASCFVDPYAFFSSGNGNLAVQTTAIDPLPLNIKQTIFLQDDSSRRRSTSEPEEVIRTSVNSSSIGSPALIPSQPSSTEAPLIPPSIVASETRCTNPMSDLNFWLLKGLRPSGDQEKLFKIHTTVCGSNFVSRIHFNSAYVNLEVRKTEGPLSIIGSPKPSKKMAVASCAQKTMDCFRSGSLVIKLQKICQTGSGNDTTHIEVLNRREPRFVEPVIFYPQLAEADQLGKIQSPEIKGTDQQQLLSVRDDGSLSDDEGAFHSDSNGLELASPLLESDEKKHKDHGYISDNFVDQAISGVQPHKKKRKVAAKMFPQPRPLITLAKSQSTIQEVNKECHTIDELSRKASKRTLFSTPSSSSSTDAQIKEASQSTLDGCSVEAGIQKRCSMDCQTSYPSQPVGRSHTGLGELFRSGFALDSMDAPILSKAEVADLCKVTENLINLDANLENVLLKEMFISFLQTLERKGEPSHKELKSHLPRLKQSFSFRKLINYNPNREAYWNQARSTLDWSFLYCLRVDENGGDDNSDSTSVDTQQSSLVLSSSSPLELSGAINPSTLRPSLSKLQYYTFDIDLKWVNECAQRGIEKGGSSMGNRLMQSTENCRVHLNDLTAAKLFGEKLGTEISKKDLCLLEFTLAEHDDELRALQQRTDDMFLAKVRKYEQEVAKRYTIW